MSLCLFWFGGVLDACSNGDLEFLFKLVGINFWVVWVS